MTHTSGEFELIDWIRQRAGRGGANVAIGIGDDAAALSIGDDEELLVATDTLLEGVHFDRSTALPREIGRKAAAVNVSDLAAMAARPIAVVCGLTLTKGLAGEFVRELMAGMIQLAESQGASLVGGDVTSWDGPLAVNVTAVGVCPKGKAVRRSGAHPGDAILVTGPLGGSLGSGRHYWFQPRVTEALALVEAADVHAMIDLSDGLAADLGHVCDESGCGATLVAEGIPIHEDVGDADRLSHALGDGEDFELLFTVDPADAERLLADPPAGLTLFRVGETTDEPGLRIIDANGNSKPLDRLGWSHDL